MRGSERYPLKYTEGRLKRVRRLASGPRAILRVILSSAIVYASIRVCERYVASRSWAIALGCAISFFLVLAVCALTEARS